MNKPLIKSNELDMVFDGSNYYIPVLIAEKKWVLNFESDEIDDADQFFRALELALGLGGSINDFKKHLSLNGSTATFIGGVKLEELNQDELAVSLDFNCI